MVILTVSFLRQSSQNCTQYSRNVQSVLIQELLPHPYYWICLCNITCISLCGGLVAKLCPTLAIPWTVACQTPLSMGFSSQEYWNGLPFPSPGDLLVPGIEPGSPALQSDSLPTELHSNLYFPLGTPKFGTWSLFVLCPASHILCHILGLLPEQGRHSPTIGYLQNRLYLTYIVVSVVPCTEQMLVKGIVTTVF